MFYKPADSLFLTVLWNEGRVTLLQPELPKFSGVFAMLSAVGFNKKRNFELSKTVFSSPEPKATGALLGQTG